MYDVKCYELAKLFLSEAIPHAPEKIISNLAQEIQDCIEDFITLESDFAKALHEKLDIGKE